MNELQMTCFEIISYVGTAKSMYINAVQKAKEGDYDAAEELIKQGDDAYNGGHDVHMGLLKKEANGERDGQAPLIRGPQAAAGAALQAGVTAGIAPTDRRPHVAEGAGRLGIPVPFLLGPQTLGLPVDGGPDS